ncbi:transposase [Streptomyces sp. NPDC056638]|uniref:transposase n=1 Tax=Streptomyces sp. NPDC056638 TaxID=3345887 RepID=UPI003680BA2C
MRGHEEGIGGSLTGRNPVDRGKRGSKLHVLSDAQGLPLVLGVSGANVHDSQALLPLVLGIPAIRSRRRPAGLRADKAYNSAESLQWLRERGLKIGPSASVDTTGSKEH